MNYRLAHAEIAVLLKELELHHESEVLGRYEAATGSIPEAQILRQRYTVERLRLELQDRQLDVQEARGESSP